MSQIEDLRIKIKKLKYKLQKEQKTNNILLQQVTHLNTLNREDVSIERVMKKISLMLGYKGMTLKDWILALSYSQKEYLQNYIDLLQKMGVRLDQRQKSILVNFMTGDLTQKITLQQVSELAIKSGVRIQ